MTRLATSSRVAEYERARPWGRARAGLAPPPTAGPLVDTRQKKEGLRLRAGNAAGVGSPFQGGHSDCRPGRLLRCLPASSSILLPDSLGPTARRSSIAKRDHLFHRPPIPNRTTHPSQATQQRPGGQPPGSPQIPLRSTPCPLSAAPFPLRREMPTQSVRARWARGGRIGSGGGQVKSRSCTGLAWIRPTVYHRR